MIRTFLPLLLSAAALGCGKHPGSYAPTTTPAAEAARAVTDEADSLWAQRADEAKLQEALKAYEAVLATEPTNRVALERLTRGWYFWGDAYAPNTEVAIERWGKAIEFGTRCLALNPTFAAAIAEGKKEKDAAELAGASDVPCLYWTATALGKWGKAQSLSKTLKHLPTVKAYIARAEVLDPTYFNYGPARYWGAYYAALPSFAGQDFGKSAEYFEASINGAPYYLATRVLRAEMLAVSTGDYTLFRADLEAVLAADPNQKPEADVQPENLREKEKAQRLLDRRAELFDKKTLEAAGG